MNHAAYILAPLVEQWNPACWEEMINLLTYFRDASLKHGKQHIGVWESKDVETLELFRALAKLQNIVCSLN